MAREDTYEPTFSANRELRVIPEGWAHPRTEDGRYQPLFADDMPEVEHLPREAIRLVAYETTTEGTPISPPFPDTPEGRLALTQHCAEHETTWGNHRADAEAWAVILFGTSAAVTLDGTVVA